MLIARVVDDQIEDDPQTPGVGRLDEPVEVGHRAEQRIDGGMVADVVAEVATRRGVERREPDRIDPERVGLAGEVIEVGDDAVEIADAIAVAVGEAARVDLIDDPGPPPVGRGLGSRGRPSVRPTGRESLTIDPPRFSGTHVADGALERHVRLQFGG